MKKVAIACSLLLLMACGSNKTEHKPSQISAESQPSEGFLGTPWGTELTSLQATWLMRPESELGEVTVYQTGITSYKTIPVQSTTAAFRRNKLIGMGFEIRDRKGIEQLID